MRHGRAKAARRTLQFFKLNTEGNIAPPYKVLVDGTFLVAAVKNKVELFGRVQRMLQNEKFSFFVTRADLDELLLLDEKAGADAPFAGARQFGLDECTILEPGQIPPDEAGDGDDGAAPAPSGAAVSAYDAVRRLIGRRNPAGYLVASQDDGLLSTLRRTPNVPVLRLHRGVLCLDTPSGASKGTAVGRERGKLLDLSKEERTIVGAAREQEKEGRAAAREREKGRQGNVRVKRKARGPNPLSCKKKK